MKTGDSREAGVSGAAPQSAEVRPVPGLRCAVVAACYNRRIVEGLLRGCLEALREVAAEPPEVVRVPGAFELPLALQWLARGGRFQGLVALGAVVRGETAHFEHVAAACARGVSAVSLEHSLPIGFGVLAVHDLHQALERSAPGPGNRGREAALAMLEMVRLGVGPGR